MIYNYRSTVITYTNTYLLTNPGITLTHKESFFIAKSNWMKVELLAHITNEYLAETTYLVSSC